MRHRPTRRAVVVAGIGGLLVLAGATAQAGWLFVLAAGVLGLVAGSWTIRHRLADIEVTRQTPRRVRVGDDVPTVLAVSNTGRRATPLLALADAFGAFGPVAVGSERLSPAETARAELLRPAVKRGSYLSGSVTLTSAAPFGLVRSSRRIDVATSLTVVPGWADLASFPILEPSSSPSEALHERARTGAGEEFLAVREFRPGDPLRAVHWRSTARAGTLVVREFETEIASTVGLVLAGADHGSGPGSSFEMQASAVASIGIYALTTGHPLHAVRRTDGLVDHLDRGSRHDLLDWLATASPEDGPLEPLVDEALSRLGRRSTIVVCCSTSGTTGASIPAAIARIQQAGSRAILVTARATSWDPSVPEYAVPAGLGDGRVPHRMLENGRELGSCLAA